MNFETAVLLLEVVLVALTVAVGAAIVVYKNAKGMYTAGLPWPLEPIAAWLNNKARQPWQAPYFNSIITHAVLPAVYTGVFKVTKGRLHILLTPRSDEFWKDVLHVPGSICRTSDRPGFYEDALARVQKGELKGMVYNGQSQFAGCGLVETRRCKECFVVFVAFTNADPTVGAFYPADDLPVNLIDHEATVIIPTAIAKARELMTQKV